MEVLAGLFALFVIFTLLAVPWIAWAKAVAARRTAESALAAAEGLRAEWRREQAAPGPARERPAGARDEVAPPAPVAEAIVSPEPAPPPRRPLARSAPGGSCAKCRRPGRSPR